MRYLLAPLWLGFIAFFLFQCIVVTGKDNRPEECQYANSAEQQQPLTHRSVNIRGRASQLLYSPDGETLAVITSVGIWLYETHHLEAEPRFLGIRDITLRGAALSSNGRYLLAYDDRTVWIWEVATGSLQLTLHHPYRPYLGIRTAGFSPDGQHFLTSTVSSIYVWDTESGDRQLLLEGYPYAFSNPVYSPDGSHIVAFGDTDLEVWDATTGRQLLTLVGHDPFVSSVSYRPDGERILSSAGDGTARVWNATTGQLLLTINHGLILSRAVYTLDGRYIITIPIEGNMRLWNAETGEELTTLEGYPASDYNAVLHPDGRRIITVDFALARILAIPEGDEVVKLEGHSDSIMSAIYNPEGTQVATASRDGTVRIWDAVTGRQLTTLGGFTD
jgi:WD40 repeat protein